MVSIAVVIPSIPPRRAQRDAVIRQVEAQTRQPDEMIVWIDEAGAGAAATRNIAMAQASSDLVAFFDDDDEMYPRHLELLESKLLRTNADLVYPWHDLKPAGVNPLAVQGKSPFRRRFDLAARRQILEGKNFIPIPVLVNRRMMLSIGGFQDFGLEEWDPAFCEVLDAWQKLLRGGAAFVHCPHKTWAAVRDGLNTAGLNWHDHIGTKQRWYDE